MKKQLLIISALFISMLSFAQGIVFEQGTWKQVLAKAKLTNKPIFVDVFTTWCGPCKKMSSDVFPLAEVGKVYNANYVCYQIDAEKGEGIEFAKTYEVKAYPTYLFIKPDGTLFSKSLGSMPAKNFIEVSTTALTDMNDPKPLAIWDKEYLTKKKNPVFLLDYMNKREKLGKSNAQLFDEYLNLIPEERRTSDTIINLYNKEARNLNVNSLAFKNLQKNKDVFIKKMYGTVYTYLYSGILNSVKEAAKSKNELLLNSAIEALDQTPKNLTQLSKEEFYMDYYKTTGDSIKYMKYITAFCNVQLMTVSPDSIAKHDKARFDQIVKGINSGALAGIDSTQRAQLKVVSEHLERNLISQKLNNIAWEVFGKISNVNVLKDALRLSKRSLELDPKNPAWMDTYANLLYKLGQKEEAIIIEEETMNLDNKESKEGFKKTVQKMKTGEKTW
jgi:thiol-disulfide isomerase/thioredoxin